MALSIDQMDLTNDGFDIGIVMQRDTVRRPVGDVGNAKSFPFPGLYQQVHDATVWDLFDPGIALAAPEPWVDAARDLERAGVKGISGGCGFMAIHQPAMSAAVDVPVFTSALMWVPLVAPLLGRDRRIGIMTVNSQWLSEEYYLASGWSSEDIPVLTTGVEDTEFAAILRGQKGRYLLPEDRERLEEIIVNRAEEFVALHPSIGAIVLECTNFPPYADAIKSATGRPVFHIVNLIESIHQTL